MEQVSSEASGQPAAGFRGPMPPHGQLMDFLPEADRDALLDWALGEEANFKTAKIFYGPGGQKLGTDPRVRQALKLRGAGPFEPLLQERLLAALPEVMAIAGFRGVEPRSIEFELNAYGDGAHFAPHIDIAVGEGRKPIGRQEGEDRLISSVYYFYREPKGFSGGRLRLFRFGVDAMSPDLKDDDSIAFEPVQNSLVVFPSWARHGVERVACPSGRFSDFRFGLNCWFCRRVAG